MAEFTLTKTRLRAGVWEGVIKSIKDAPEVIVVHLEKMLAGVQVVSLPNDVSEFLLSVPIPANLLNDGVQTFVIIEKNTEEILGSFAIVAGSPLEVDLRAEIDLLRAELDLLKRAFRRHCVETN
jgi:hypothetical protein